MNQPFKAFDARTVIQAQEKNPFAKISDIVYNILAEAILSSAIAAGSKLNVTKLSEQLGVSNSPVTRAMERLVEDGLVTEVRTDGSKYRNYFVFDMTNQSLMDLFVARRAIEGEAAFLCAQKQLLIDLDSLKRLANDFQAAWQDVAREPNTAPAISDRAKVDLEFHRQLVMATENKYLIDMFLSIGGTLNYLSIRNCEFMSTELRKDNLLIMGSQHVSVCNAIESGIPQMARTAMQNHLDFCSNFCLINRAFQYSEPR